MICLSLLAILGAYAPVLKSFPSCLSTCGVAAPAGHPVFFGAGGAAGLVRDRGVGTISAESKGFGPSASFLLLEAVLLPALWGTAPLLLVLQQISRLGFHPDFSRFRAGFRLFRLRRGLSWRSAGGVFPWRLSSRLRPSGRASARVSQLRQRERQIEGTAYCLFLRAFGSTSGLDFMYFSRGQLPQS